MKFIKLNQIIILFLFSFLTACANKKVLQVPINNLIEQQQKINQIKHWSVKGRIAVTTPEEKFSSNYSWQRTTGHQELMLYGSFGNTYAYLVHKENIARLTLSDKEVFESEDVESLLEKVLGYPFPIEKMQYWFKGLPHPDSAQLKQKSELIYDEIGYLKSIHHDKWTITYKKFKAFKSFNQIILPTKITITDGQVIIKLSNRSWQMGTDL